MVLSTKNLPLVILTLISPDFTMPESVSLSVIISPKLLSLKLFINPLQLLKLIVVQTSVVTKRKMKYCRCILILFIDMPKLISLI
jgi:hypothetical protein